jgi:hypothetical protein
LETERCGINAGIADAAWEPATMGNTKFVEASVAGGGGVAGDCAGDSGVYQGRDEEGMAASGFGDKTKGEDHADG